MQKSGECCNLPHRVWGGAENQIWRTNTVGRVWRVSVLQIPADWLADHYGGKRLFGCCILISSVISLPTPVAARAHFGVILLLRIVLGLCDGFLYPAVHALVARWSAPKYRSTVTMFIFMGFFSRHSCRNAVVWSSVRSRFCWRLAVRLLRVWHGRLCLVSRLVSPLL